jgi:hypothetical protein
VAQPEWPNNGIEFNHWYHGLTRFILTLKHFEWIKDSRFKYVNVRIDTRNGSFLVLTDETDGKRDRVDPLEIAQHVDMKLVDDEMEGVRERRHGIHLLRTARSLGWPDDGEGALEFLLRRAREVAFEDCGCPTNKT